MKEKAKGGEEEVVDVAGGEASSRWPRRHEGGRTTTIREAEEERTTWKRVGLSHRNDLERDGWNGKQHTWRKQKRRGEEEAKKVEKGVDIS